MFKDEVTRLLQAAMDEDPSLFVVEFSVGADHRIKVVLDGDQGVDLADCMRVSRALEHNLDREEQDFSLEVTSAGATTSMSLPRQYLKNVGRTIAVRTDTDKYKGTLVAVRDEGIALEWRAREPKPIGKGKVTVTKTKELDFITIKEAKVILKF